MPRRPEPVLEWRGVRKLALGKVQRRQGVKHRMAVGRQREASTKGFGLVFSENECAEGEGKDQKSNIHEYKKSSTKVQDQKKKIWVSGVGEGGLSREGGNEENHKG